MDNPLLAWVVNVAEHFEITKYRELNRLFEKSFFPLAIGDLSVTHIGYELNLINAAFTHVHSIGGCLESSI